MTNQAAQAGVGHANTEDRKTSAPRNAPSINREASMSAKRLPKIDTTWDLRSYDVWGNTRDGYEVNDSHAFARDEPLRLQPETHNAGTPEEFVSAYPSDSRIRALFGVRCRIETDGDDLSIYVNRARDGYPIGEMHCTSHESLSPVRPVRRA